VTSLKLVVTKCVTFLKGDLMTCPQCGSDEWKSASMVYASGLTEVSTATVGGGAGADAFGGGVGAGVGVGRTGGTHQTELSKQAAPPEDEWRPAGVFTLIGFVIILLSWLFKSETWWTFGVMVFVASVIRYLATPSITKKYAENYAAAKEEYQRKRVCMRCGTLFLPKG
jgi:hypothetical protein